eukprot:CAMPEP_0119554550 /NCGR_PEP_ID=MMETSP1352-20130426/7019_1 /TAXON_ID=265584 /ORGANISM="Stauroneis constricta, Strain CCMP1120" /LENGTH=235 /DNA_ID=CAMNT_0007601163 /DNA_START=154 /DNA_END=861 /DNA_ORIENTATION=+
MTSSNMSLLSTSLMEARKQQAILSNDHCSSSRNAKSMEQQQSFPRNESPVALTQMLLASTAIMPSSPQKDSFMHHHHSQEPPTCLRRPLTSVAQQQQQQHYSCYGNSKSLGEEPIVVSPGHSPQLSRPCRSARDDLLLDYETPSPLIASSFKTMEREYNRNTWRMYERIQGARLKHNASRNQHLLSVVGEALDETLAYDLSNDNEEGDDHQQQQQHDESHDDSYEDDEDIFDFEL